MLIEHDMRVVFNLADRIMVLGEGRLWPRARRRKSPTSEPVQRAYLGEAAT